MTIMDKQSGDDAMQLAMAWLDARGIHYLHLPPHQLKVDAVNFWPGRGTLTVDGENKRRTAKGLSGLEATLISEGLMTDRNRQVAGVVVRLPRKP
jgi:hypothetical protein